MFQKKQFTIITRPQVKISFLLDFINSGGYGSAISYIENLDIWANQPHKIIDYSEGVYNDKSYYFITITIPFHALKNEAKGFGQVIKSIAKYNKTIAFYEHGTFQTVYDFRNVPTPSTDLHGRRDGAH